jgi:hypothetical protein
MKTFLQALFLTSILVAASIVIVITRNEGYTTKRQQEEKTLVDKILKGESVKLSEFPQDEGCFNDPCLLAVRLGYSEEDIQRLEGVILKLPEPTLPEASVTERETAPKPEGTSQ